MVVLRELKVDSRLCLDRTLKMVNEVGEELYDLLARHCYDVNVYDQIFTAE